MPSFTGLLTTEPVAGLAIVVLLELKPWARSSACAPLSSGREKSTIAGTLNPVARRLPWDRPPGFGHVVSDRVENAASRSLAIQLEIEPCHALVVVVR